MIPTLFGLISIAIGLALLVRGTSLDLLRFMMFSTLFSGSAAIVMTALGGSSISPAHLALVFLVGRILLPGSGEYARIGTALSSNAFLVIYALYGAASAFILPRMFAGQISITPLRPLPGLFDTVPLTMTTQNITTAVYMIGTMLSGVCASIVAQRPDSARKVVGAACIIAWVHATFGVLGVILTNMGLGDLLNFFRNGSYGQLEQSYNGMVRMSGIFPEASYYASYAFVWFVFLFECWMRDVQPRRTGPAAIALLLILIFSTSGSAYLSLAAYGALLVLRLLILRQQLSPFKVAAIACGLVVASLVAIGTVLLVPQLADQLSDMFRHMTMDKAGSDSGRQRSFWAMQGLDAFIVSYGLGIGAGSFRSSSLFTAMLGSMGVVGVLAFVGHLLRVFKPLRASTYSTAKDERSAAGSAASWTVLSMMIPAAVGAASADPGMNFAILGGLALEWRRRRSKSPVARARRRRPVPRRPIPHPHARSRSSF
ncbi:MAG TPA: hypothetical protein VM471_10160 [Phenylobacterium sp.]|nr:hypothetical protein [Phenylobacterium sp.]